MDWRAICSMLFCILITFLNPFFLFTLFTSHLTHSRCLVFMLYIRLILKSSLSFPTPRSAIFPHLSSVSGSEPCTVHSFYL